MRKRRFDAELIADIMGDDDTRRAFCYLTAPPISEDDLKTLAEASLSPARLLAQPDSATRIRDIVFRILDPPRFPWLGTNRVPTKEEKKVGATAFDAYAAHSFSIHNQERLI
jgi:XamI restriction endonuclease